MFCTLSIRFYCFQLDYVDDVLQNLSSYSDSSGEESGGEEEKKEDTVDEDDQAEQAKLPQYASRFRVGVCCSLQVCFCLIRLVWNGFELSDVSQICFLSHSVS